MAHPFARSLGAGDVEYFIDQETIPIVISHAKNISGNLNQVTLQLARIPAGKRLVQLIVIEADCVTQHMVSLADQLHVTILNTIVNHLDVMTGTAGTDPFTTGNIFVRSHLGSDCLEDRLHQWPSGLAATGHHAGSLESPFFTTRNPGAYIKQALRLDMLGPALGISKMSVATIDDHVTRRHQGNKLID